MEPETKERQKKWQEVRSICLLGLKRIYSDQTDKAIAEKIGIPRATFNRIKNKNDVIPTPENIIRLLVGSDNKNLIRDAMEFISDDLLLLSETNNGSNLDKKIRFRQSRVLESIELQELLAKKENFIVYEMASLKKGANQKQITKILGHKGSKSIKVLREKGILFKKGGNLHTTDKGLLIRNNDALKNQLTILLDFYDPSLFREETGNSIIAFSDGLNENALKLLQEEFTRHYNKLKDIYRNPKNLGRLVSFSGGFCDVLNRTVI